MTEIESAIVVLMLSFFGTAVKITDKRRKQANGQ